MKGQIEELFEIDRSFNVLSIPTDIILNNDIRFDEQLFVFTESAKFNHYLLKSSTGQLTLQNLLALPQINVRRIRALPLIICRRRNTYKRCIFLPNIIKVIFCDAEAMRNFTYKWAKFYCCKINNNIVRFEILTSLEEIATMFLAIPEGVGLFVALQQFQVTTEMDFVVPYAVDV